MSSGYIVVKHQLFKEISDQEIYEKLAKDVKKQNIHIVDVKHTIINMDEIDDLPHIEAKAYQRAKYENEIRPLLERYPSYTLAYFGSVSVPLALHLGFCVGSWHNIIVFISDRVTGEWIGDTSNLTDLAYTTKFPKNEIEVSTDVLFKVEASFVIQDAEAKESIASAYQSLNLSLGTLDKNAFKGFNQVVEFGAKFSEGLDSIANYIPAADKIHLLVTAPVGVVFYLGTRINPNVTKPIVTYQYNTNKVPKYEEIFVLQEEQSVVPLMDEADKKFVKKIRKLLKKELEEKISVFSEEKSNEGQGKNTSWIDLIMPAGGNYDSLKCGYWKYLSPIPKTPLVKTVLIEDTHEAEKRDGFYLDDNGRWQLTDRFIFNVSQRLNREEGKVLRALRMFILHEGFHTTQMLTNHTASSIGRFPRILEEADYVADVWTFFHEYALSKRYYPKDVLSPKEFFKDLFLLSTETMWSFVELSNDFNEIQIRGLNRFLIWYWAYNLVDDPKCRSLNEIMDRLAIKPIVELKGLQIRAVNQRTIFKLNRYKPHELEIGYFDPLTSVKRHGNAGGINLVELVEGFRTRNGSRILDQMKALYHNVGPLRFEL